MNVKQMNYILLTVWVVLLSLSFLWNYQNSIKEQERIAFSAARSFFDQIIVSRQWNARHGGLYAPVTAKTQPNPFLHVPNRDIQINEELMLTKINPAFMTRQISKIAMEKGGIQFHITSLKPISPKNKPTPMEEQFLLEFERGKQEVGLFIDDGGKQSFFFMAPLLITQACLKCHAKHGYRIGDVRGGISVKLPFVMEVPLIPLIISHLIIGLFGGLGIVVGGSRLEKAYTTIQKQAVSDMLTGIPNRRSFSKCFLREYKRSCRKHRALSLIIGDIDNFKAYNDTYGHQEGDNCLKKVAREIERSIRRSGDFCARYGGEEFIVILPETDAAGAETVAENIRANVEKLVIPNEKSLPARIVTISLGVAGVDDSTQVFHEELIKYADLALYEAKEKGRNRVECYRDIPVEKTGESSDDKTNQA